MSMISVGDERLSPQDAIRRLVPDGRSGKDIIARAAGRIGCSYRQMKALFYGETSEPRGRLLDRIEAALTTIDKKAESHAQGLVADASEMEAHLCRALEGDPLLRRSLAAVLRGAIEQGGAMGGALAEGAGAAPPAAAVRDRAAPDFAPALRSAGLPAPQRQG